MELLLIGLIPAIPAFFAGYYLGKMSPTEDPKEQQRKRDEAIVQATIDILLSKLDSSRWDRAEFQANNRDDD